MALTRKDFLGNVPATTLAADVTNSSTSITLASGTGWPQGINGPFGIVVEPGTANEEKIICSSRSGNVLTVAPSGRGADGTVATAHTGAVTIKHVFMALDADDNNAHIYTSTRDDHPQYLRADGARAMTGGLTVASGGATITGPVTASGDVSGATLTTTGDVTVGGDSTAGTYTATGEVAGTDFSATGLTGATQPTRFVGGTVSGAPGSGTFKVGDFVIDGSGFLYSCTVAGSPGTWTSADPVTPVWTSYTPTITNGGNGTVTGSYLALYKVLYFRILFTIGSTKPTGAVTFTLPNGYTAINSGLYHVGHTFLNSGGSLAYGPCVVNANGTTVAPYGPTSGNFLMSPVDGTHPYGVWNAGDVVLMQGTVGVQ